VTSDDRDTAAQGRCGGYRPRAGNPPYDFLRNKRQEWADYRNQVTPFELTRYLPML
jgi:glutamine synthetase